MWLMETKQKNKKKKKKSAILVTQYTEWPSSDDSSDNDYIPMDDSDEEQLVLHKKRRQKVTEDKTPVVHFSHINAVPIDVWVEIFSHCVELEGALPFLVRASRVCRMWYEASKCPRLWQNIDLTYGWIKSVDSTLKWLSENRLLQCKSLNLSGWKNLSAEGLRAVALNCPNLENLDISNTTKKLQNEGIDAITQNCPKLSTINLLDCKALEKNHVPLESLLTYSSNSLTHLTFGGIAVQQQKINELFNTQLINCHNLEVLELFNISCTRLNIDIEKFQISLRKLSKLVIIKCPLVAPKITKLQMEESVGFPMLKHLSLSLSDKSSVLTETAHNILKRLLKNSHNLEILELDQFCKITPEVINYVMSDKLKFLRLSRNAIIQDVSLVQFSSTLEGLDLSDIEPRHRVNELLSGLVQPPGSQLSRLDVSNSQISLEVLQLLLKKLQHMKSLNISYCRELPRGIKRLHIDKEIQDLRKRLL
ncbi:F-box/LRR-repeat protein 6 isoform X2 [Octopus bimaculoides]|nr:F-box/LRR-repeat protein 6 isoform X2 [Octopus bimaculoides]|eukprot:XP_014788613.1 PREDICTED: F-box/LRR-repeat protein 6-like isoform X2 [Octopus bimaculoides]